MNWNYLIVIFLVIVMILYFWGKVENKEGFRGMNPFLRVPEEMIAWKPYVIDVYNQPGYNAYFFDNHYMYPLY